MVYSLELHKSILLHSVSKGRGRDEGRGERWREGVEVEGDGGREEGWMEGWIEAGKMKVEGVVLGLSVGADYTQWEGNVFRKEMFPQCDGSICSSLKLLCQLLGSC